MYLNFRSSLIVFCCVIGFYESAAQTNFTEKTEENVTSRVATKSQDWVLLSFSVGNPYTYGDTFLQTYAKKKSYHFTSLFFINTTYYLGYDFTIFKATPEDTVRTGIFDKTTVCHYYLNGGRLFKISSFPLSFRTHLGIGWANYRNKIIGNNEIIFKDEGFSISATGTLEYKLTSLFNIHLSSQWTRDFIKTETSPEIQSFFDRANYIFVYAGITISLRSP